tara:strand:- start:73 stop:1395 length:1323 start_codon:yes stop_codon:yes gene_type:complete
MSVRDFRKLFSQRNLDRLYIDKVSNNSAVGVDGVNKEIFSKDKRKELRIISSRAISGNYKFTRYSPKLISRGPDKNPRIVSIPTIRDRIALRALHHYLRNIYSSEAPPYPHTVIKNVVSTIEGASNDECMIRIDVKDFYPSIRWELLKDQLSKKVHSKSIIQFILRSVQNSTYKKKNPKMGIPQGLSVSNILSHIYMIPVDEKIQKYVPKYYRYVDDVLIFCERQKAESIFYFLKEIFYIYSLNIHELESNSGKSEIKEIYDKIDYLGYSVAKNYIGIRKSSITKFYNSIVDVLYKEKRKNKTDLNIIYKINLRITGCIWKEKRVGWIFYFQQTEDIYQLKKIDLFIKEFLISKKIDVDVVNLKKMTRSYYQIKHHINNTKYIPNFDKFDIDQKRDYLLKMGVFSSDNLIKMNDDQIKDEFTKIITKEASEMEQDLFNWS